MAVGAFTTVGGMLSVSNISQFHHHHHIKNGQPAGPPKSSGSFTHGMTGNKNIVIVVKPSASDRNMQPPSGVARHSSAGDVEKYSKN